MSKKILRVKQTDFLNCDTALVEMILKIQLRREGFDFGKPITRWTDFETLEEVFEQEDEKIEIKTGRIAESIRAIFKTKRT